ncbi:LptF/LptG family permease [Flavobacteriales bacterium]|nr:LptF/LptG family permease [Flavobacteriales bacterium]
MLKKLDWFIIKSYIVPFVATFFIAEFVLIIQFMFVYLDDLVGKGVGINIYSELMLYAFLEFVPMALPLAILLSSIMAMGNLGEKNELTAAKAAGVSLLRVMRPLLFIMIMFAGISFYFSNYVWGNAYLKKRILINDMTNKKLSLVLKEGVFFNEIDNYSIRANEVDKTTNMLGDILIYQHDPTFKYRKVIRAKQGQMQKSDNGAYLVLTLYEGEINEVMNPYNNPMEKKSTLPNQKIEFFETTQKIDISSLQLNRTSEEDYGEQPNLLPVFKLTKIVDSLQANYDTIKRTLLGYYSNSLTVTREHENFDWDTIQPAYYHLDSLLPQEQKAVLKATVNRLNNSVNYLDNRSSDFMNRAKYKAKVETEWHRKFTLSLACILLFLVGAPLGAIVKKGGLGIPVAIAITLFVVYYIISITGERLCESLVFPPYIGMWLSSIVLLPLGIIFTYQAATESKIFDFELYGRFFRKIGTSVLSIFKKKKA